VRLRVTNARRKVGHPIESGPVDFEPFNFLLEFYSKRPDETARQGLLKTSDDAKRQLKPISPIAVIHIQCCRRFTIASPADR
jgi:hypothetical protein